MSPPPLEKKKKEKEKEEEKEEKKEEKKEEEKEDILSLDLTTCTDYDCDSQLKL